ncbi:MAG TPA: hypothetical protein VGA78_01885 [Gemmatimonadales bacterium]
MTWARGAVTMMTLAGIWPGGMPEALAQKRQRDLITREELVSSAQKSEDLYQAIRSLRPHFLLPPRGIRTLGAAPPEPTVLYVDGTKQGGLDGLKSILTMHVEEVRYLEPSRAQHEYGFTHSGGAVIVKLAKFTKPPAKPDSGG